MKNEILKNVVAETAELAKDTAKAVLKEIGDEELKSLVVAELASIIDPLEEEIKTTKSMWARVRNRMYVSVLNRCVDVVIARLKKQIEQAD